MMVAFDVETLLLWNMPWMARVVQASMDGRGTHRCFSLLFAKVRGCTPSLWMIESRGRTGFSFCGST